MAENAEVQNRTFIDETSWRWQIRVIAYDDQTHLQFHKGLIPGYPDEFYVIMHDGDQQGLAVLVREKAIELRDWLTKALHG